MELDSMLKQCPASHQCAACAKTRTQRSTKTNMHAGASSIAHRIDREGLICMTRDGVASGGALPCCSRPAIQKAPVERINSKRNI
jgi:hypothetical protein